MGRQDGSVRQVSDKPVDDPSAHFMHVDMDAFFVSVALLNRPELRSRPVIVGRVMLRSVVAAANYPARRYGVNSGMPMAVALRRCPDAVVLEPHPERYGEYSRKVMGILAEVTPLVEQLSIDEAFLDVSGVRRLFGDSFAIGSMLRARVYAETGLRCSVGAASSKFVAKMASSRAKPDGLLVIPEAETLSFLHPLPAGALWGVGLRGEAELRRLGVRSIGDIARTPLKVLVRAFGQKMASRLHELSWGMDERGIQTDREEKSVGREVTFAADVNDAVVVYRVLLGLADSVARSLRHKGLSARTLALKLRFADFDTLNRSRTLAEASDTARRIYTEVRDLYDRANPLRRPVRLVGVRAENLVGEGRAVPLWDDEEKWRGVEHAVDAIAGKFGPGAVLPGALVGKPPG